MRCELQCILYVIVTLLYTYLLVPHSTRLDVSQMISDIMCDTQRAVSAFQNLRHWGTSL